MAANASLNGPDVVDVEVGLTLRSLRKQQGISQQALATGLGVSFQQVQKYERGANRISASMLVKASRVLGIKAGDLLPQTDEPSVDLQLQRSARLLGAQELLDGFAEIKSLRHRKAVLALIKALGSIESIVEADLEEG